VPLDKRRYTGINGADGNKTGNATDKKKGDNGMVLTDCGDNWNKRYSMVQLSKRRITGSNGTDG
jgi:hypothetical protein